jgi:hypothetical protein
MPKASCDAKDKCKQLHAEPSGGQGTAAPYYSHSLSSHASYVAYLTRMSVPPNGGLNDARERIWKEVVVH